MSLLPAGPRRRHAFTLLEMMVALLVGIVLISFIVSIMGLVRAKSEGARCVSNLKSIGIMLMSYSADHQGRLMPPYANDVPTGEARGWARRLLEKGYSQDEQVFLCPSFFPRTVKEMRRRPSKVDASEGYGLRGWTLPDAPTYDDRYTRIHKPIAAIANPSDFFLVADSFWSPANWHCQGYSFTASRAAEGVRSHTRVHIRHEGRANALFADGHVEAKDANYFLQLNERDRQAEYMGGPIRGYRYQYAVETDPDPALPQN
ncbi:MAG TPA: H-X9-DG-CTERM domain-containing protein [Chthoniobacteraceae bacterium]|nr:H-X9-DG-CTERM domain-containing protein [Chthoniobacteraceae bacterium]